jgi:hypothetical protein
VKEEGAVEWREVEGGKGNSRLRERGRGCSGEEKGEREMRIKKGFCK